MTLMKKLKVKILQLSTDLVNFKIRRNLMWN